MVEIFEMKCLSNTGRWMNQKIQIWHGLTGKQNFGALLTHMLLLELEVLNWIKHRGLIQPWRKICAVAMLLKRKAIRTRNPKDWANYRLLRNRISNKVKTTKVSYYHDSFIQSEGNAGRTWRTIINLMSRGQNNQIVKEVKVTQGFNDEALIFFRLLLSNCLNWKIYCDDHISLSSTTAVQIWIISYNLHIISLHGKIWTQ